MDNVSFNQKSYSAIMQKENLFAMRQFTLNSVIPHMMTLALKGLRDI